MQQAQRATGPRSLSPPFPPPLHPLTLQVYVIGGLVDRTVQKGATLALAQRCGARAVRLPIVETLGGLPTGRGVLNINDVFEALLAVHAGQCWAAALEAAVPQRLRRPHDAPAGGAALVEPPAAAAARQQQQGQQQQRWQHQHQHEPGGAAAAATD